MNKSSDLNGGYVYPRSCVLPGKKGTTYVPAERESGSIAGALSHTLSFSLSIGPERGHEKRLINRTNTGTFLSLARERERERERRGAKGRERREMGEPASSSSSQPVPAHHTLHSRICVRGRGQDERRREETARGTREKVPTSIYHRGEFHRSLSSSTKTGMRFLATERCSELTINAT
ncbi:hypothetical protein ALC62_11877 [Cyphomyrmex costatus]|uniref:Uncharacterized protein n=1 Tax=Cyphomyrmex costatus TaxID=456900 RepID=A0A195CBV8_9HYME|nr:hypothetical protein ALC62_11877 [Cyphomyrmex costatus]